jgi:hypothetical protein
LGKCTTLFPVIFYGVVCEDCVEIPSLLGISKWTLKNGTQNVPNIWSIKTPSQ